MRSLAPIVLGLCIYLVWPASALARAVLRFVHAVPGAGTARVEVTTGAQTISFGSIAFAQATGFRSLRSGQFHWRLVGGSGSTLASGTATVGDGTYTAVFLLEKQSVTVGIYRDRAGEPGTTLLRVIHAAPELGSPELELDGKVVLKSLPFPQATPYLRVAPGVHSLAAMRPGDKAPLLSVSGVRLVSDVAYSVVVVGSRGQKVRVVTVVDRGAPLTHPAPARKSGGQGGGSSSVTVQPGDSLWRIARRVVGPSASNVAVWREVIAIWDANASRIGTGDPNLIFPGTRLTLPAR
jgi:hypothetical protein